MKNPSNKTELMGFLKMLTYLSRYLPHPSTSTENMRKLTRDKTKWVWSTTEDNEFNAVKSMVTNIQT